MDSSQPTHALGENASLEVTAAGVGEARVALFAALTRGAKNVPALAEKVVNEAGGDARCLADLVVLMFQTRDCRGGKGEKDLFQKLYWEVLGRWPAVAVKLLPLVPEYGSWRDVASLWDAIGATEAEAVPAAARSEAGKFRGALEDLYADRLKKDLAALGTKVKPSLAGKYAPREGKRFAPFGKALAGKLFPGPRAKADYRKAVAKLAKALDVPEVKMCGKRWAEIEVEAVPSRCLAKSRKAFLNEKLKRSGALSRQEDETGDRHPDDEDRVACRKRVREAVLKKAGSLKGKQLFPHEIVRDVTKSCTASTLEDDVANAQWAAIMKDVEEQLAAAGGGNLGKLIPLSDVSGSMSGVPMQVSIALGVVVSDLAGTPFKNRVLTFESEPRWHELSGTASATEKIRSLARAPWGGSTDFAKALDRVLEACVKGKVSRDEVPDLIVFSDMQFDVADRAWLTHHQRLVEKWREAGYETPPTITYWNLRGATGGGFAASAETPGVRMLSGFSPSLLKLVLTGEEEAEEVIVVEKDGTTRVETARPTPFSTMRKALDDGRYDPVRFLLAAEETGAFADYAFEPAADDATVGGAAAEDFEMVDAAGEGG